MSFSFFRCIFITLLISFSANAQQYSFRYLHSSDIYTINSDGDQIYCLFKAKESKTGAVYRKVFLNENLQPIDSVEYEIDGKPRLIASGANEFYTYHAFETKVEKVWMINFLVTDKSGNIVSQFNKTPVDLIPVFSRETSVRGMMINFISDNSKGVMLMELQSLNSINDPALTAWNFSDGKFLWKTNVALGHLRTTETQVIGLTGISHGQKIAHAIHFFDKATGRHTSKQIVMGEKQRSLDVFASNGNQIMLAGAEFEGKNKNSRLYMSMFDMEGNLLFDRMDTTDRMGKYRRQLLGSAFDADGNLVLIGQGYKIDATKAIVTTTAAVAASVFLGGGYIVGTGEVDNRIDLISSAVISSNTGEIKLYRNFPVGPWHEFATFYADGARVLISINNKLLFYNVDEPTIPPKQFGTIKTQEKLFLTSYGPAVTYRKSGKSRIFIELLARSSEGPN